MSGKSHAQTRSDESPEDRNSEGLQPFDIIEETAVVGKGKFSREPVDSAETRINSFIEGKHKYIVKRIYRHKQDDNGQDIDDGIHDLVFPASSSL